jgi:hypothetical protein
MCARSSATKGCLTKLRVEQPDERASQIGKEARMTRVLLGVPVLLAVLAISQVLSFA